VKQKGGKIVYAWALEGDIEPSQIKSNTFEIEWSSKSGKRQEFSEIDKGGWFIVSEAKQKINQNQVALIKELMSKLNFTEKEK